MRAADWEPRIVNLKPYSDLGLAALLEHAILMQSSEEYERLAELFVGFSVIWVTFSCWWVVNTWIVNERHSKPLHSLMTYVLGFKCLNAISTCGVYATEFSGDWFPYWQLAMCASFTLYNTFTYSSFVLISKGFCITRDLITNQEASSLALIMAAVYFGFSAYTLDPSHLSVVLFLCLVLVQYFVVIYAKVTIARIRNQLVRFAISNIHVLVLPTRRKLSMMTDFACLVWVYFGTQVAVYILAFAVLPILYDNYGVVYGSSAVEESFEFMSIGLIFFLFRARYQGQYFNIELSGGQHSPQVRIAPIYKATLQNSAALLPNQQPQDAPIIIIPPVEMTASQNLYSKDWREGKLELLVGLNIGGKPE